MEPTKPKLKANKPKNYGSPDGYTAHTPGDVPSTPAMNVNCPKDPSVPGAMTTIPVYFDDAD